MNIHLRNLGLAALGFALAMPPTASALTSNPHTNLAAPRTHAITAVMADGRVMIAGGLSLPTTTSSIEIYDPSSGRFKGGASLAMIEPRERAASVTLPTGQILIAGGQENVGSGSSLRSAELFDPVSEQSTSTGMLGTRRHDATATLLADGRVLIVGGADGGDGGGVGGDPGVGSLSSAEIYDPLTNQFSPTGSMSTPRERASAVLLADGRVLVVGGYDWNSGSISTSEIYDPDTGQFGNVATMVGGARQSATTTLLTSGKVLIAGGVSTNPTSAIIYDPLNNSYSFTGSMATARIGAGAVLLPSGKVLLVGGQKAQFAATSLIESFDPASGTFAIEGNLSTARANASVSLLPNGRILVAGGYVPPPDINHGGSILRSSELIDGSVTSASTLSHSMTTARADASSSILMNGRILIAGGRNASGVLASAEVFSDALDTFTGAGPLAEARDAAISALLPDGSVLIAGGRNGSGTAIASAERFNPQTQTFSTNPRPLWQARYLAGSAVLANGHVLIVGGRNASGALASSETYDGHTGMFRMAGALATARSETSTVLLGDGTVLVAGGQGVSGLLASAERYDPLTRSFSATSGNLATPRRGAMTALLPNGKVLIAGGRNVESKALASAELFDPETNAFSTAGTMLSARADAGILVMPDGTALIIGGIGPAGTPLATTEIYDPGPARFSPGPALATPRARAQVALTTFGHALIAGGEGSTGTLASAETQLRSAFATTFTPARPDFVVDTTFLALPGSFALNGQGLRGSRRFPDDSIAGSEGSSGGYASVASNAPLLRLQRIDNQQVTYQASNANLPWTDLNFTTPILTRFDPFEPASRMAGVYRVVVGANGIQSSARYLSMFWIEDEIFQSGIDGDD